MPHRRRMPVERQSLTHKFSIAGHEGYITAGQYDDGSVGEIFLTDIGKEGSTLRGMMNAFATSISVGLQYGVPLETFVDKFSYMRFEPEGMTTNKEIPFAKSMPDYIMRWLASRFCDEDLQEELGIMTDAVRAKKTGEEADVATASGHGRTDQRRQGRRTNGSEQARGHGHRRLRPAGCVGRDQRTAGRCPGAHEGPGPRPRVRSVRRHDAAHRLLLHVPACGNNTGCG